MEPLSVSTDPSNTVIVLGGGLAGLSLALGLSQDGYHVEVVERSFGFSRTGATFGLGPNGRKAIEELYPGIAEELERVGIRMPSTGGTMLGWWNVRDALLARVRQENQKITLHLGYMVQEIVDGEISVKAIFEKRKEDGDSSADGEELCLEGIVLVGADGVNSAVRDHLGMPIAKKTNVVLWRSRLKIESDLGESEAADLLRPYLDIPIAPFGVRLRNALNYVLFNFHEKDPGTMALVVNFQGDNVDDIQPGTSPKEFMEANAEDDKELKEIQAALEMCDKDGLHHPVRLKVIELPKGDGYGWGGIGRITLTGDAAHAMRPASGQGGSMAFEDSVVLCRALKKVKDAVTSKSATEGALKEFENTRLPRIRKLWGDQWERSESAYKNINMEPWSKDFSDWVFNGV